MGRGGLGGLGCGPHRSLGQAPSKGPGTASPGKKLSRAQSWALGAGFSRPLRGHPGPDVGGTLSCGCPNTDTGSGKHQGPER